MEQKITTCFVAGRSGGHIVPALTLAQKLHEKNPSHKIIFFTTATKLDTEIIAASNHVNEHITLHLENIPFKNPFKWPVYAFRCIKAFAISFKKLRADRPDKVVSMGGYVSVPVCCAAKILGIPIELYELNVEPGQATTLLARCATTTLVCFEETITYLPSARCKQASYPVRFAKIDTPRTILCQKLAISAEKKVVLVLGGSQGSLFINTAIKTWLETDDKKNDYHLLHQIGGNEDLTSWRMWYQKNNIHADIFSYRHDMQDVYAIADIIICRSGAGTLFESLFFGKKCITIPLETVTNKHQVANARAMTKKYPDLVTVISQKDIETKPMIINTTMQVLLN